MSLLGLALLGLAKLPYRIAKAAGQRFLEAKRTRKVAIPTLALVSDTRTYRANEQK